MKRVLQIVSCMELGGTEAFIMNNYRVLDRSKYQFDFVIFHEKEYPYLEEIENLGGRVFFSGTPSLDNIGKFIRRFKAIVSEGGPYIAVHTHVNIDNAIPLLAAYLSNIPVRISHSHATSGKERDAIRKTWYYIKEFMIRKYATSFLACSMEAGKYLYGDDFFTKSGKVIPNGIDVNSFIGEQCAETEKLKKEWKIQEDCPLIIGNISRFDQNKNSLFALWVFQKILGSIPDAVLIMGGPDGGKLDDCIRLAEELGISNRVRFVGKRRDIPTCLKLLDIYLFPSLSEGLGIVLLEAQASGCCCIVSEGVSREVDQGINSVLFLPLEDGAQVWAEKILDFYSKWSKPAADTTRNAFLESGFDIREAHKRLMAVYE